MTEVEDRGMFPGGEIYQIQRTDADDRGMVQGVVDLLDTEDRGMVLGGA
jgi:hypothetical protein